MNRPDVTPAQARTIGHAITPTLEYLGKLSDRMRQRGFTKDDPLMVNVSFALEAVRQLRAALHAIEEPPARPATAGAEQIVPGVDSVPQWRKARGDGDV